MEERGAGGGTEEAAARGFLDRIPTAVIFRTSYVETERCTKKTWVRLLPKCFFLPTWSWMATLGQFR